MAQSCGVRSMVIQQPLRLTLCRQVKRKIALLHPRTVDQLYATIKQKFRYVPRFITPRCSSANVLKGGVCAHQDKGAERDGRGGPNDHTNGAATIESRCSAAFRLTLSLYINQ